MFQSLFVFSSFCTFCYFQMAERQDAINNESFLQSENEEKVKQTEKKRSDEEIENSNNLIKDVSSRDKTKTRDLNDHLTEAVMASLLYG